MLEIGQIAYDSLTTRAGAFQPAPRGSSGLFGLGHDLLFALNQIGHHGGVKNALALRRRRKLFRCALRIPLPRQAVVPLRQRLCLALGSSLRPMSVPAVCPDSLATKFKRRTSCPATKTTSTSKATSAKTPKRSPPRTAMSSTSALPSTSSGKTRTAASTRTPI